MQLVSLLLCLLALVALVLSLPIQTLSGQASLSSLLESSSWQYDQPFVRRMAPASKGKEIQMAPQGKGIQTTTSTSEIQPAHAGSGTQSHPGAEVQQSEKGKEIAHRSRDRSVAPDDRRVHFQSPEIQRPSSSRASPNHDIESNIPHQDATHPDYHRKMMDHHLGQARGVVWKSYESHNKLVHEPLDHYLFEPWIQHMDQAAKKGHAVYTGHEHDGFLSAPTSRPKALLHATKHAATAALVGVPLGAGLIANGPAFVGNQLVHSPITLSHYAMAGVHGAKHVVKNPHLVKECVGGICKKVEGALKTTLSRKKPTGPQDNVRPNV
jgi:hypothetical protein